MDAIIVAFSLCAGATAGMVALGVYDVAVFYVRERRSARRWSNRAARW